MQKNQNSKFFVEGPLSQSSSEASGFTSSRKIPNSKFQIPNSSRKGFTLIEIIVTMAIMAILATAGTQSFLGFRNKNRLRLAGDEVSSLLRLAHDRAVSQEEGKSWGVYFNNDSSNSDPYYVVFYGSAIPNLGGTTSSIKYLDKSLKFNSPAYVSPSDYSTTTLFDQLTGNVSNITSPVIIQIAMRSDTDSSTTIKVYPNGRVDY